MPFAARGCRALELVFGGDLAVRHIRRSCCRSRAAPWQRRWRGPRRLNDLQLRLGDLPLLRGLGNKLAARAFKLRFVAFERGQPIKRATRFFA